MTYFAPEIDLLFAYLNKECMHFRESDFSRILVIQSIDLRGFVSLRLAILGEKRILLLDLPF